MHPKRASAQGAPRHSSNNKEHARRYVLVSLQAPVAFENSIGEAVARLRDNDFAGCRRFGRQQGRDRSDTKCLESSLDREGDLYGTTVYGGDLSNTADPCDGYGCGVVFKIALNNKCDHDQEQDKQ